MALVGVRYGFPFSGVCLEFWLSLILGWHVKEDGMLNGLVDSLHFSYEGFFYLPFGLLMVEGLLVKFVVGTCLEFMVVGVDSLLKELLVVVVVHQMVDYCCACWVGFFLVSPLGFYRLVLLKLVLPRDVSSNLSIEATIHQNL